MSNVLKNIVSLQCQTINNNTMSTNNNQSNNRNSKSVDVAAKQLWKSIVDFQQLLLDNVVDDSTCKFYLEFLHKSSEFARYIDKNFYND